MPSTGSVIWDIVLIRCKYRHFLHNLLGRKRARSREGDGRAHAHRHTVRHAIRKRVRTFCTHTYTLALTHSSASTSRRGKGPIYVVGTGTHALSHRDQQANLDNFASSPYTIAVGGLDEGREIPAVVGFHAKGFALFVVAPTSVKEHVKFVSRFSLFCFSLFHLLFSFLFSLSGPHSFLQPTLIAYSQQHTMGSTLTFKSRDAPTALVAGVGILLSLPLSLYIYILALPLCSLSISPLIQCHSLTCLLYRAVALILEANPMLTWHDVQEVLIASAYRIQPTHPSWVMNGAGYVAFLHTFKHSSTDNTPTQHTHT